MLIFTLGETCKHRKLILDVAKESTLLVQKKQIKDDSDKLANFDTKEAVQSDSVKG